MTSQGVERVSGFWLGSLVVVVTAAWGCETPSAVDPTGEGGGSASGFLTAGAATGGSAPPPLVYLMGHRPGEIGDAIWTLDLANLDAPPVLLGHVMPGSASPCGDGTTMDVAVSFDGTIFSLNARGLTQVLHRMEPGEPFTCTVATTVDTSLSQRHVSMAPPTSAIPAESLVALDHDGSLFSVDPVTGAGRRVGHLPRSPEGQIGASYGSDVVFFDNQGQPVGYTLQYQTDGVHLLAIDAAKLGPENPDVLLSDRGVVHPDPTCGTSASSLPVGGGLVAYQDKVLGIFASEGSSGGLYQIDVQDASACRVAPLIGIVVTGSGISSSTPVVAPPR